VDSTLALNLSVRENERRSSSGKDDLFDHRIAETIKVRLDPLLRPAVSRYAETGETHILTTTNLFTCQRAIKSRVMRRAVYGSRPLNPVNPFGRPENQYDVTRHTNF